MTLNDWLSSQKCWALQLLHDNDFYLHERAKEFAITADELKQRVESRIVTSNLAGVTGATS